MLLFVIIIVDFSKRASKWLRNLARLSNELNCFRLPFRCSKVNFVHFLPSPANEARFSLKTFQFTSSQSNVVYIHCQAVVCLAKSSQCSTDCSPSRRTKRDVSSDTSHLLSMGPLMFVTKRGKFKCQIHVRILLYKCILMQ